MRVTALAGLRTMSMGSACKRAHASLRALGVSSTYTDSALWAAPGAGWAASGGAGGCTAWALAGTELPSPGPSAIGPLYMNSSRSSLLREVRRCGASALGRTQGQDTRDAQDVASLPRHAQQLLVLPLLIDLLAQLLQALVLLRLGLLSLPHVLLLWAVKSSRHRQSARAQDVCVTNVRTCLKPPGCHDFLFRKALRRVARE
jgi:hypothetical protein